MIIVRHCFLAALLLVLAGCGKDAQEKPGQQQVPSLSQAPASSPTSAGGIRWTMPGSWKLEAERPMRVATYTVSAAEGEADAGECAAYYFGADQGGDVQANVDRWAAQFEGVTGREQSTSEVAGMPVTNVTISGSYLAPSGPMMQSQGKKEHYKLLGAIIDAPKGRVFFKFTGPEKTIDAAKGDFEALVSSISKE